MKESPIFLKSFETLLWLLEHTRKFPKHQRFVMAKRMEEAALCFHDSLVWASKTNAGRKDALRQADYHLARLKVYNRLAMKLRLLSFRQYECLARQLDEIGRILGGWQRKLRSPTAAASAAPTGVDPEREPPTAGAGAK